MQCTADSRYAIKSNLILAAMRKSKDFATIAFMQGVLKATNEKIKVGVPAIKTMTKKMVKKGLILQSGDVYQLTNQGKKFDMDIRCENDALDGAQVCRHHGGQLSTVRLSAKQRLAALVDPSIDRMQKVITKGKHDPSAIAAAKDILDRNGFKVIDKIEITHGYDMTKLERLTDEELVMFRIICKKLESDPKPDTDDSTDVDADTTKDPA